MSNITDNDLWLIFQNDHLFIMQHDSDVVLPTSVTLTELHPLLTRVHTFGEHNGVNIHCAELSPSLAITHRFKTVSLRHALESLGEEWFAIATKAFTIINWDRNHHFCGRCSTATTIQPNSYERRCQNCHINFYPRISPSVIVLIQKGEEILMARSPHFKPGIYGLIAGFVEAGESLEETIHREVYEETRIRVKNLKYYGSQVWPFPDSLMVGFFAEYESGELNIDNDEIEAAGWYHYNQLPGRPSTNISIASKMLDHFIHDQQSRI